MRRKAFELLVEQALANIPPRFRDLLKNVEIEVKDVPGDEAGDLGDDLLGLYVGPTWAEMSSPDSGGLEPGRILLYQHNLEDSVDSEDELKEEVAKTLLHEIAHHFGFSEEDIHDAWPEGA